MQGKKRADFSAMKQKMNDLRKQFKIVKASEEYEEEKKSTMGNRVS